MSKINKKKTSRSLPQQFRALGPYMKKVARGSVARNRIFSLCVKSSAAKCYEFNLSIRHSAKTKSAFFAMSSLRGICEDLIVLRFVRSLPPKDRQELLDALSGNELGTRIKLQEAFFRSFRPQQPVLRINNLDSGIAASEAAALAVWNRQGWPLLRSGWGPSPKDFVFSAKHFHGYFEQYCSLYGAFLFCLYFEFFGSVLKPGVKPRAIVSEIRQHVLMTPRWPEMVTFEEMNQKPPEGGGLFRLVVSAAQAASRPRLISKSADYTKRRSSERKFVREVLQVVAAGMESDRKGKLGA